MEAERWCGTLARVTESYDTLKVERQRGVAFVTIDHPPINLLDTALTGELARLQGDLATDDTTRVVVFRSADPEFFIAHADLAMIRNLSRDADGAAAALAGFHGFLERWRTADQITIAQLEGRARGGGSEFALATCASRRSVAPPWASPKSRSASSPVAAAPSASPACSAGPGHSR